MYFTQLSFVDSPEFFFCFYADLFIITICSHTPQVRVDVHVHFVSQLICHCLYLHFYLHYSHV